MMLHDAIAWTRRWFVRYESLWSIARKLAASNLATMEQVLCHITCRPELPSTRFFFQDEPHRNAWLAAMLRLDARDASTVWLDGISSGPNDPAVCTGLRYCPRCMKQQFHSVLYQSYLLRNCPVHDVPLTTRCPRCKTPKLLSAKATSSFSECLRCGEEYFNEPRGWLDGFNSPDYGRQLAYVHECLARRRDDHYVESSVREWAQEPGRVVPDQMPAYALLGDALLERVKPVAWLQGTLTDDYGEVHSPKWFYAQRHASMVQDALAQLAASAGIPPSLGLPVHGRSTDTAKAAHLLVRYLGVRPGQDVRQAGRTMNSATLSPLLSSSQPFKGQSLGPLIGPDAERIVALGVRGLFLEALNWVRAPAEPHSWDQWPLTRQAAPFPVVWHGRQYRASSGASVQANLYGPTDAEFQASINPTLAVGNQAPGGKSAAP